jgi:hypothetical protein
MAKKFTMSIPDSMSEALEKEKKERKLKNTQDTIRYIISEYFKDRS